MKAIKVRSTKITQIRTTPLGGTHGKLFTDRIKKEYNRASYESVDCKITEDEMWSAIVEYAKTCPFSCSIGTVAGSIDKTMEIYCSLPRIISDLPPNISRLVTHIGSVSKVQIDSSSCAMIKIFPLTSDFKDVECESEIILNHKYPANSKIIHISAIYSVGSNISFENKNDTSGAACKIINAGTPCGKCVVTNFTRSTINDDVASSVYYWLKGRDKEKRGASSWIFSIVIMGKEYMKSAQIDILFGRDKCEISPTMHVRNSFFDKIPNKGYLIKRSNTTQIKSKYENLPSGYNANSFVIIEEPKTLKENFPQLTDDLT